MFDIDNLTEHEKLWLPSYFKSESQLKEYENNDQLSKDYVYSTVKNYHNFLDMIFEYENLRIFDLEYGVPTRKLVKLNRVIASKELDFYHVTHIIMEGMCVVANVVTFDAGLYRSFVKKPTNENRSALGLDKYNLSLVKVVSEPGGREVAVTIADKLEGGSYIRYFQDWDYLYF